MAPPEDDTTYVIRLNMPLLRARFKVDTDDEIEDILMGFGILRDLDPGDWVCEGRCLVALEPAEIESKRRA